MLDRVFCHVAVSPLSHLCLIWLFFSLLVYLLSDSTLLLFLGGPVLLLFWNSMCLLGVCVDG